MNWSMLRTVIILPGTALVFVPALVLWGAAATGIAPSPAGPAAWRFWVALALLTVGLAISVWTSRLFLTVGEGTPAPWDPPRKLVVGGPYRHVRNPMITSVLVIQLAEALYFASWPLAGWMVVFWLANAVYFPLSEERDLEARFGDAYRRYKANVPRWLPRFTPWGPPGDGEGDHAGAISSSDGK